MPSIFDKCPLKNNMKEAVMCKKTRENRTITVDFNDKSTYYRLIQDRKALIEFIIAFIFSIGFQLKHKAHCCGGFSLTPHSSYNLAYPMYKM